jgi:hypothetical protein
MNEPMDLQARQLALTALTTEHSNLQTARMSTIAEANGRSTLYLGTLSSAVIAIAFIGRSELGDAFYLFALTLLPSVFLLGVFSYLRLAQTSVEDLFYAVSSLRIREYFMNLDPAARGFFPRTDLDGLRKLERMGFLPTSRLQLFLTAATMVACINSIVGGVTVALAARSLVDASVMVAAVTGGAIVVALVTLFLVDQMRRFQRAAAVVPELYEWESSGIAWWNKGLGGPGG